MNVNISDDAWRDRIGHWFRDAENGQAEPSIGFCSKGEIVAISSNRGYIEMPMHHWLQALDTEAIAHALLDFAWEYIRQNGYDSMAGERQGIHSTCPPEE